MRICNRSPLGVSSSDVRQSQSGAHARMSAAAIVSLKVSARAMFAQKGHVLSLHCTPCSRANIKLWRQDVCSANVCVAAREKIVGWYSTGPRLREADLDIQELFAGYCNIPVLVICEISVSALLPMHHNMSFAFRRKSIKSEITVGRGRCSEGLEGQQHCSS